MAVPVELSFTPPEMPEELSDNHLRPRLLLLAGVIAAVILVVTLLPGLAGLRHRLAQGDPAWLAAAAGFKLLSGLSYVVIFRAVFCRRMSWRLSYQIGMSELAANALLPVGGAGGLALGAWALRRGGMAADHIARRSVAFFLLTSAANVAVLILVGLGLSAGVLPGHAALALTLVPVVVAIGAIVMALLAGRLAGRLGQRLDRRRSGEPSRVQQAMLAISDGVAEALVLLRGGDWRLIAGALGYLCFDLMVLWATFRAFGPSPAVPIIWIAYLIGQLGGLIPVPGGLGGVDAGLVGTLTLYGAALGAATAAVLGYRAVVLWVPAIFGGGAFFALRRTLRRETAEIALCTPGETIELDGVGRVVKTAVR